MQFRSFDGSGNNLGNSHLSQAGTDFARLGQAHFADGISTLESGPNPREISNLVVGQGDADVPNPEGLSGMMYAWGQFIDHDLDLAPSDGKTDISIKVPAGDPNFAAGSTIGMTRTITDPATGQGTHTPATAVNSISGWLDASMVYGSSNTTAAGLRLADGHMKTSAGNNLPVDNGMFLAGDVRAQENPSLTALQTLFVREHNHQVDLLHKAHPNWTGDHLYQQARAIVTAEIEHITYNEFLPHLLGPNAIHDYKGYNPHVDPRITEEFAGAAYRFGHSIVSADTERLDNHGAVTGPELSLKDTFFLTASNFEAGGGADGFLRHLGSDPSQALDVRIVNDLRNFLVDPPDGMDLAAINIQRGRDLGLGTLNQTRADLGLKPYKSFDQITDDAATAKALKAAYGTVDKVDLWTGGLAEKHVHGAMVGQTFEKIIATQFEHLRDGDRLWYQNQGFDSKTLDQINHTTLSDIIERNTDTGYIQNDAFAYYSRHSGTLGGVASDDPTAPQLVIGSKGTDTLLGGPKNDILVPAAGNATLTGLGGNDKFVFTQQGINATITDFKPGHDTLQLNTAAKSLAPVTNSQIASLAGKHGDNTHGSLGDFQNASIHSDHGSTIIDVGGDHIKLVGVTPKELMGHDLIA